MDFSFVNTDNMLSDSSETIEASILDYSSIITLLETNESLLVNNNNLCCTACSLNFIFNPSEGITNIKRHIQTKKHLKNVENISARKMRLSERIYSSSENTKNHQDLIKFLTVLNIPLSKIDDDEFRQFATDHFDFTVASSSYYRKTILPEVYIKKLDKLKDMIDKKEFYLIFDGTTDSQGRHILCIMIGMCNSHKYEKPFLLKTVEVETGAADLAANKIITTLYDFLGTSFDHNLLKHLVTDQAPAVIKSGKLLKELFPKMKHVSCIAHLLHNICEKIRSKSGILDRFIADFKRLLVKNKDNQKIYLDETDLPKPKFPVITRWGTWLQCVDFVWTYSFEIKKFVEAIDDKYSTSYAANYNSDEFEQEIRHCKKYSWIIQDILFFEQKGLSVEQQIFKLKDVYERLEDEYLKIYFNQSLTKNPDISFFRSFNEFRSNNNERIYSFVPLTSVDVERCFSIYRNIFIDQRQSLSMDNLDKYMFIYVNKDL